MSTQIPKVGAGARAAVTWAFPVLVGFTWVIWPALDPEWLLEKGLGPDPEADLTMVHNARMARLEAYQKQHGGSSSAAGDEDADDEEEEENVGEEANEEEDSGDDGEEEQSGEDGGDEESGDAEEDEEEEEEIKAKPLFEPTKGTQGGGWDTFTVKSLKFGEDDDEEEDDEDDGK
jgi:hypothetical protein